MDDLEQRNEFGDTPLLAAVAQDDVEGVRSLLQRGADSNVKVDDGYTCLLTAIESSHPDAAEIVGLLIESGADLRVTGTNGWTPLHMAAFYGRIEAMDLLIAAGGEIDRRTEIDDEKTPLMEAAFAGQPQAVRLLLVHGADPGLRDTVNGRNAREIAAHSARGADPEVLRELTAMGEQDLAHAYREQADLAARTRDHAEVLRVLDAFAAGRE